MNVTIRGFLLFTDKGGTESYISDETPPEDWNEDPSADYSLRSVLLSLSQRWEKEIKVGMRSIQTRVHKFLCTLDPNQSKFGDHVRICSPRWKNNGPVESPSAAPLLFFLYYLFFSRMKERQQPFGKMLKGKQEVIVIGKKPYFWLAKSGELRSRQISALFLLSCGHHSKFRAHLPKQVSLCKILQLPLNVPKVSQFFRFTTEKKNGTFEEAKQRQSPFCAHVLSKDGRSLTGGGGGGGITHWPGLTFPVSLDADVSCSTLSVMLLLTCKAWVIFQLCWWKPASVFTSRVPLHVLSWSNA